MAIPSQYYRAIIQELEQDRKELLEYLAGDHDLTKTSFTRGQIHQIDQQIRAYLKRIEEKA